MDAKIKEVEKMFERECDKLLKRKLFMDKLYETARKEGQPTKCLIDELADIVTEHQKLLTLNIRCLTY